MLSETIVMRVKMIVTEISGITSRLGVSDLRRLSPTSESGTEKMTAGGSSRDSANTLSEKPPDAFFM